MSNTSNQDLDLSLLYEIADGSDEFVVESIAMFLQQMPESLQDINNAIDTQNWTEAALAAHKLKATLGFFGMISTQALIQDIETSCKTGTPDAEDVSQKFTQVQVYIADSIDTLTAIRAEAAAKL